MIKALRRVISKLRNAAEPVVASPPVLEQLEERQHFSKSPIPLTHGIKVLNLRDSDGLSITSNEFLAAGGGGKLLGKNLEITDNVFQGNMVIEVPSGDHDGLMPLKVIRRGAVPSELIV